MAEVETKIVTRTVKLKPLVACWCGCGGTTRSRFVPGHDARFHGRAKKVARNELDMIEQLTALPHDEARAEFERHVEMETPKAEAKAALEAQIKALKSAKTETADAAIAAEVAS